MRPARRQAAGEGRRRCVQRRLRQRRLLRRGDLQRAPAAFDASVFVNTPLTVDAQGNVFFGFIVTRRNPAGLVSGIARVDASGVGSWTAAALAAGDARSPRSR
jgi:hypothetical protein